MRPVPAAQRDSRDTDLGTGELHVKPNVGALGAVGARASTAVVSQLWRADSTAGVRNTGRGSSLRHGGAIVVSWRMPERWHSASCGIRAHHRHAPVGNGPSPTRVVYALATPMTQSILLGALRSHRTMHDAKQARFAVSAERVPAPIPPCWYVQAKSSAHATSSRGGGRHKRERAVVQVQHGRVGT